MSFQHSESVANGLKYFHASNNIGITHAFSCINICQGRRKLFIHEANRMDRVSANAMEHVRSLFLHILPYTNQICTETLLKH